MMPYRVYEMMTKRQVVGWTVRVWTKHVPRQADPEDRENVLYEVAAASGPSPEVLIALNNAIQEHGVAITRPQVADAIERLGRHRVAAYEIVDKYGFGVVVYPDWN